MRVLALVLVLALLVVACPPATEQARQSDTRQDGHSEQADIREPFMPDKLITDDGKSLAYTFYPNPKKPGAILMHQLRRDRHDYDAFAPELQKAGFAVISIDVRGHGESSGKWELFSAADFRKIPLDIAAAKDFLAKNNADTKRLLLVGASFTANTVINYPTDDRDVKAVIALSPGLDFRGIKPQEGIANVPNATLLVAADDDAYSAQSVRTLYSMNDAVDTKFYPIGGHAVALFNQTTLSQDLLAWLKGKI